MSHPITQAEARCIACEKLLQALPGLLEEQGLQRVLDWLEARQILLDGQEDPGAVETEGLALELAVANSFHRLAEVLRGAGQAGGE